MKKAWKIISVLLEVLLIAAAVCNHFVPAVNLFLVPYIKYILIALTVFSVYWVIYLAVAIYHKEVGHEVQGKIKYKKDKERKVETIVEADTLEVYSNFERAEFTSKIKDSYQKQVYAFPANMPAVEEKAIPETAEEVIKSAKPTVRIVTDKKPLAPSVVKASKTVTKPEEPKYLLNEGSSSINRNDEDETKADLMTEAIQIISKDPLRYAQLLEDERQHPSLLGSPETNAIIRLKEELTAREAE